MQLKSLLPKKFTRRQVDLDRIIANYPSFHVDPNGSPWFLGISGNNFKYMHSLLRPEMTTVETGAGFSTLAFIAAGCRHTAICPAGKSENQGIEQRIRSFCSDFGLDHSTFTYWDACSQDVLPQFNEEIDFAFVDGFHGFPIPIIDFYYLSRKLKVGGVLAIDDTNIWSGEVIAKVLMMDSDWEFLSEQDGKTSYLRRIGKFRDKEFSQQPFVLANSRYVAAQFISELKR